MDTAFVGNWIDVIVIICLVFYLWEGSSRGFINLCVELLSFCIGAGAGLIFYPAASALLQRFFVFPVDLAHVASFAFLWLLFQQASSYVVDLGYAQVPHRILDHPLNRRLSIIPLIGEALLLFALALLMTSVLPYYAPVKSGVVQSYSARGVVGYLDRLEKKVTNLYAPNRLNRFSFVTLDPTIQSELPLYFIEKDPHVEVAQATALYEELNNKRGKYGVPLVGWDDELAEGARVGGAQMLSFGSLSRSEVRSGHNIKYKTTQLLALVPQSRAALTGLLLNERQAKILYDSAYTHIGIAVLDTHIHGVLVVINMSQK